MASLKDIRAEVDEAGGVTTVPMGRLRDAVGMKKLGVHVIADIAKKLRGEGLGHYPDPLPLYQEQFVRVFVLGSEVDDLLTAVLDVSPDRDERLRQAAGGAAAADAETILAQVRDLVCGAGT